MTFTKKTATKGKTKNSTAAPAKKVAKKGGKPVRKPPVFFDAPEDFKPFFLRVRMTTAKDGIITKIGATRFKGRPETEGTKSVNLAVWDPQTLLMLACRWAGPSFVLNAGKRLPGNVQITAMIRVGKRAANGSITVSVREIWLKESPTKKAVQLERTNPYFRLIRKAARILPGAFIKTLPFPTAAELKALSKDAE